MERKKEEKRRRQQRIKRISAKKFEERADYGRSTECNFLHCLCILITHPGLSQVLAKML